ncbi:MAG: aminopeptidase P family protein [Acidobacteria bacterium]|nr:aminopeptidase P family protein [Acidobacteriota bacterium]
MKTHDKFPYPSRLAKLRTCLAEKKLEALLVSFLPNVHYLTGFSGSAGLVLISRDASLLFTDSRYTLQAHEEVKGSRVVIAKGDSLAAAAKRVPKEASARIGFESQAVSYQAHQKLRSLLPGKRLVAVSGLVELLRMEKEEDEIDRIRKASEVASRALLETLPLLRPGIREREVAAEIEYRMRLHGADRPSFETIVAFGDHAALPHAHPGERRLRPKECILIDLGAILGGYASDMTRTVFLGEPSRQASQMYQAVLEALKEAEAVIRVGVAGGRVDAAARRVLKRHGYGRYFTHSTGHGVGREVHELPRLAPKQNQLLPERAVVTVEPGVYIPGYGGVRIEDMVVVRKDGIEVLTPTSKELLVL